MGAGALLIALAGACASPTVAPREDRDRQVLQTMPVRGKQTAPVTIAGTIGRSDAVVEVTFAEAGSDASVTLYGAQGLIVRGDTHPLEAAQVQAGQTVRARVAFDQAPPGSSLAVNVRGVFAGAQRSRVVSFAAAARDVARSLADEGVTLIDGQRVRLMPAQ